MAKPFPPQALISPDATTSDGRQKINVRSIIDARSIFGGKNKRATANIGENRPTTNVERQACLIVKKVESKMEVAIPELIEPDCGDRMPTASTPATNGNTPVSASTAVASQVNLG